MRRPRHLLGLSLIALSSCASPAAKRAELARRIDEVLARPELKGSTVGIEVRRLSDGALLYERNAEALLAPASTTKIVSSAGALILLGKDFRFRTRLVRTGELAGGTLQGDLVLVASGDPNLSQRIGPRGELLFVDNDHTYAGFLKEAAVVPGDPLAALRKLAASVKAAGVERIEGSVVVDDGLFQESYDEFVQAVSAACVNDNVIDVTVTPAGAAGEPPSIDVQPVHPEVAVENRARTASDPAGEPTLRLSHLGGLGRFELSGTIPLGSKPVLCVAQFPNPALAAAHFLEGELVRLGITVRDPPERASAGPQAYSTRAVVAAHVSPPLSEAVKVILKVSHNLHATMLPVIVGAQLAGKGDRFAGYRLIREALERGGVDCSRVVLRSGSGGGRADSLSARFLVNLLAHLATRPEFEAFYDALPVGGVDGTLATHFTAPPLRGRVRAKTGTLVYQGALNQNWVYLSKALAGYLELGAAKPGEPGDLAVFAILMANSICASRREGSDALFRAQEDILAAVKDLHGRR